MPNNIIMPNIIIIFIILIYNNIYYNNYYYNNIHYNCSTYFQLTKRYNHYSYLWLLANIVHGGHVVFSENALSNKKSNRPEESETFSGQNVTRSSVCSEPTCPPSTSPLSQLHVLVIVPHQCIYNGSRRCWHYLKTLLDNNIVTIK